MQAFKKAQEEAKNDTPNGQAKHIAKLMSEKYNSPITQKSMMRYYDGESTPKSDLQNALSKYLGYGNYEDFIRDNKISNTYKFPYKGIIGLVGVLFIAVFLYFNIDLQKKECMVWSEDHYKRAECTINSVSISYSEDLVNNFKKVKLDPTMTFFENGEPLYWYSKINGKVEFFNMGGKHPENGKKLYKAEQNIIRKYILKE